LPRLLNLEKGGGVSVTFFLPVVSFLVFYPVLNADYAFDDRPALVQNQDVTSGDGWWPPMDIFRHDFWGENLTDPTSHKSYRPLTVVTFRTTDRLAKRIGWSLPSVQHFVNVALHAVNCLLVHAWLLGRKFRSDLAALCSLLFAVHPVHVDSVAGIVGRADLLYTLIVLVALNLAQTSRARALFTILAGVGATLCKEQGIMLLPVVAIQDILCQHKLRIKRVTPNKRKFYIKIDDFGWLKVKVVCYLVSTLSIMMLRLYMMNFKPPKFQEGDNPVAFGKDSSILKRLVNFNHHYSLNAYLLLVPEWLCFDWSMGCVQLMTLPPDARILGVLAFWTAIFMAAKKGLKCLAQPAKKRQVLPAMAGALLSLPFLPASNLFFYVGFVIAERNLYLSVLGLNLFVVIGYRALLKSKRVPCKSLFKLGILVLIASHGIKSHLRSMDWKSEDALFRSGLTVCPDNAKIYYNIAKLEADKGHTALAERLYRKSIDLWPNYEHALNNLGNLLRKTPGDGAAAASKKAKDLFNRALEINPKFAAAWMNLAIVDAQLGQHKSAEQGYRRAISLRRSYPDAHFNLGTLYLKTGLKKQALAEFGVAIEENSGHFSAWSNKVILLDEMEMYEQAEEAAKTASQVFSHKPDFFFHLANIYGKTQRFEEAERLYEEAMSLRPDVALYHLNLGVLYHRWKKYSQAFESYRRALKIDPNNASAKNNLASLKHVLRNQQQQRN